MSRVRPDRARLDVDPLAAGSAWARTGVGHKRGSPELQQLGPRLRMWQSPGGHHRGRGLVNLDPRGCVIACAWSPSHITVDVRVDESCAQLAVEQQVID